MAMAHTTKQDLEKLVDLFLSPDFDPLPSKLDSAVNLKKLTRFQFEADCNEEESDSVVQNYQHDDYLLSKFGRKLARMGDEFLNKRDSQPSRTVEQAQSLTRTFNRKQELIAEEVKKIFVQLDAVSSKRSQGQNVDDRAEEVYEKFKAIFESSITNTGADDTWKTLGAFLLTLNGLSRLKEGTKSLLRTLSLRFIEQRQLDRDIERIGGLESMYGDLD